MTFTDAFLEEFRCAQIALPNRFTCLTVAHATHDTFNDSVMLWTESFIASFTMIKIFTVLAELADAEPALVNAV